MGFSSREEHTQMSDYFMINLLSLAALIIAISIPLYLSLQVRNKHVRNLAIILTVFVVVHSLYHVSGLAGYDELGSSFFNPLSVLVLIFFGVYILRLSRSRMRLAHIGGNIQ